MKPQTPEEILKNDKNNNWFFSDESLKNSLIEVMKEHARQCVKYALDRTSIEANPARYEIILKELNL